MTTPKKVLYFDTETTGTDKDKNTIIQLSGIIEIDGDVEDVFDLKIRPFKDSVIEKSALEVCGYSEDEIKEWKDPVIAWTELIGIFGRYVDKYNKADKLYPCAYNGYFDYGFLTAFFKKCGDDYFGSWINHRLIDPLPVLRMLNYAGVIDLKNYKLETACKWFGIDINAHDAFSDIEATRKLVKAIIDKFFINGEEK